MPSPPLALAPLSLHRPPALDLVQAAAAAGYSDVGLRLVDGQALAPECSDPRAFRELRMRLADLGLGVLDMSNIELTPTFSPDLSRRALEVAAQLGARYAQVTDWDPEPRRAATSLAVICDQADEVGLGIALEFMSYSEARTLEQARALLASVNRSRAGLNFDVLHFVRSGGTAVALAQEGLNEDLSFVQLCDAGPVAPPAELLRHEAVTDRLAPGEGSLPLREILASISPVPMLSVEAPCRALARLPLEEQARRLLTATTTFLERGVAQGAFRLAAP